MLTYNIISKYIKRQNFLTLSKTIKYVRIFELFSQNFLYLEINILKPSVLCNCIKFIEIY